MDFPAFVYPTSATVVSERRRRALRWVARVRPSWTSSRSSLVIRRLDPPPVDLELGLAGPAGPDATTLLRELGSLAPQPREAVAELGELDLDHALLARGVLGEDVEDQRDPVDDVDLEELLEVALLGR